MPDLRSALPALLLGALLLAAAGCPDAPDDTEVSIVEAVAFEPLGRGMQARLDTTTMRAIQEAALWTTYQDSLRPLQPFKAVDFEREMVLLAALPVPTGGYDLRFEVVEQAGDTLTARLRLFTPGEDCRITLGAGMVFLAVRLARLDAPLRFEREDEAYRCTEPG